MRYIILSFIVMLIFQLSCVKDEKYEPDNPPEKVILYINEIHPTGSPDWIEIYNPGADTIKLKDYKISDLSADYIIPEGIFVNPYSYLVLYCDDLNQNSHTNFKLTSKGEMVVLKDNNENLIDEIVYPEMLDDKSYGRIPDGSDNWQVINNPTQGKSND